MADNSKPTILEAQKTGQPLPTVITARRDAQKLQNHLQGSHISRAAGWATDSDGDLDDD